MTSDREALRRALQSSLSDAILDANADFCQRPRPVMATSGCPTANFLQQRELPPFSGLPGSGFDSPFLPSHQEALVAQSLGLAPTRPSRSIGSLTSDGLLLAVAAANERKQQLQQARVSLLQQQIAEENKRILLETSYLDLLRNESSRAGIAGLVPSFPTTQSLAAASKNSLSGNKTLEALGCNLRSKSDPYIDVSDMADPDPGDSTLRRTRGGVSEPFPEKLHRMLSEVNKEGLSDVVSFFSHGRAFGIHDMDRFVSDVMPKYFKQSKWNSFARQLNLYGFQRISNGPDAGGYYHELFLRGRPNLVLHMRRVGVPQGEDRRKFRPKNNKNSEPDFYSMKRIPA